MNEIGFAMPTLVFLYRRRHHLIDFLSHFFFQMSQFFFFLDLFTFFCSNIDHDTKDDQNINGHSFAQNIYVRAIKKLF